jgi:hypothetical protein
MSMALKKKILPFILEHDKWPSEKFMSCGRCYNVHVTKNARLVIRHQHTDLSMVYEAYTGDSYTRDPEDGIIFYSKAKNKPAECIQNATRDLHVEDGWIPDYWKSNMMLLVEAAKCRHLSSTAVIGAAGRELDPGRFHCTPV